MNENVKQVHRLHKVFEEGGKVIAVKLNIMLLFLVVFYLFYWDISQSSSHFYEKSLRTFMQEKLPG
jgi:hypothetical protein